jgi:hypothetical protein
MSGTIADELRALVDQPATTATTIKLIELAILVERMERQLDTIVAEALGNAQSLDGLIARVNA